MRFFYDCEFIENGRTIDLVSIGVVAENGKEFYGVSTEFDPRAANPWVRKNVLDRLPNPSSSLWMSRRTIRDNLYRFLNRTAGSSSIELWAWVGGYDHVVFCQLWGDMKALPQGMPRFTHELKQLWEDSGSPQLPEASYEKHDALADARDNLVRYRAIMKHVSVRKGKEPQYRG